LYTFKPAIFEARQLLLKDENYLQAVTRDQKPPQYGGMP
jgi:hypothetical protein